MSKPKEETRQDFNNRLAALSPEDRLLHLHFTLRNIDRVFIREYLEYSEEEVERIINNDYDEPA